MFIYRNKLVQRVGKLKVADKNAITFSLRIRTTEKYQLYGWHLNCYFLYTVLCHVISI